MGESSVYPRSQVKKERVRYFCCIVLRCGSLLSLLTWCIFVFFLRKYEPLSRLSASRNTTMTFLSTASFGAPRWYALDRLAETNEHHFVALALNLADRNAELDALACFGLALNVSERVNNVLLTGAEVPR